MEWCFKTMCAMRPLFTNEQKIITALFLASIRDMYPAELSMNSQLDPKMFYSAQLYFMLPKTVLSRYDECISSGYVMRMPPDMLAYCFNNILLLKKRISNPSDFLTPLKDALRCDTKEKGNSLLPLFADLDQEQEHFREALLWLLALEIGVAISANSCEYIAEIQNYIWGGSCRVVDAIMRGIVICESTGVSGLEVLFETLFDIIFSFCTRQQNLFLLQDTTNIEPITTLCTILSYLKQMFNSQSGVFRVYLDNFARTCDRDHAVVVFTILNNSIEAPRKGVEAHFLYDLIDVVGVIDKVYYDSLSFSIGGKQYSFAKAHGLWCTPAVFVDLNMLTDLPLFANLLVNTKYDDEVLNVFYYAALLEFVKNIKCLKSLPGDFIKRLSNMKCPDAFDMERYMTDFLFLLTSSLGKASEFSFLEASDSRDVVRIPTLMRNCGLINERDTGNSGMLLSLDCGASFVSCPIHPECQIQVRFAVSSAESAQSVDICVYGISTSTQGVLKTDNLQIIGGDRTATVSFCPERLVISLSIDNELVSNTAISPSIEMFFLVVKLEPNTIVEYECEFAEQNHYAVVFPDCFKLEEGDSKPMSFAADLPFRPCVDSLLYTRLQLLKCSRRVTANLKFLIVFYLYTKTTMKMQAKLALRLLLSANCILADETLTLESIPAKSLWMNHGPKFLRAVRKRINDIRQASLDKDFESFLGRYTIMPVIRDNTSALYIQGDSPIELANSFVFSPSLTTPLQIIGASMKPIVTTPCSLIIPITNFLGTVVETVITAKHYIMLSMIKGSYEFGVVLDGFRKVKDSFPFTAPLFHRTIEMIRALAPPLPQPNCFPVFNDVSFFSPESRIFQFPDRYLLPRYVEYVVKPKVFQGELPASFKLPHPGLVYLGVHAVESTAHRLVFQVQDDDIVLPVPVNNFVILRNQKFTIACPDPSYTCGSVRFLICPKPDCDGVSDAMRRWKPHHSHELLLSVPQDKPLTLEFFRSLPLSTKFSLGTAKFVLALLRDKCINSCLTRYQNHLAIVDHPVPDKPLKVTFTNLEDENDSLEVNSIEYCRSVASITTMTKERKLYLTKKDLSLYHSIHPNFVRLATQTKIPRELRAQITASIRAIAPGKRPEQWLKNLLTRMPSYALLMFIEFVTGQWGTSSLTATQTGHINLFYVDSPDTLDTLPEQHILVVGRFSSEARFRRRLLLRLQKYHDRLLDQI